MPVECITLAGKRGTVVAGEATLLGSNARREGAGQVWALGGGDGPGWTSVEQGRSRALQQTRP